MSTTSAKKVTGQHFDRLIKAGQPVGEIIAVNRFFADTFRTATVQHSCPSHV